MNLTDIKTLYDYDQWATNRTLDMVQPLSEDQFLKNLGSSHGGIHGTLAHIYAADWIWFERWKGLSPTQLIKADDLRSVSALRDRWEDHFNELTKFIQSLDEQKLQAPLAYKDTKGNPHNQPLVHQMQHKVNHSTYHRGQIVTLLRQIGAKPQSTDLINYYRLRQR